MEKTKEQIAFTNWMKENYGIQDANEYEGTQTEEIAIKYATQQNSELLEGLKESLAFMKFIHKERKEFSDEETDSLTANIKKGIDKFETLLAKYDKK